MLGVLLLTRTGWTSWKSLLIAGLAGALTLPAPVALAADNEAGVALTPAEAAGSWTLESSGRSICVVQLDAKKTPLASGFRFRDMWRRSAAGLVGWAPRRRDEPGGRGWRRADRLQPLEQRLFVSHRSSGVDIQLKRGGPTPKPSALGPQSLV